MYFYEGCSKIRFGPMKIHMVSGRALELLNRIDGFVQERRNSIAK